jgi:hypothetical protein
MTRWSAVSILAIGIAAFALACGDDGTSSSPTPGGGTAQPSADVSGPADGVAIFASPAGTKTALEAVLAAGAPLKFYLSGSSRDPAAFSGAGLPAAASVRGVNVQLFGSEAFDAAYEEEFGRSPADFPGVREAYDAVYLVALAAAAGRSTEPASVRDWLFLVANSPGEVVNPGSDAFAAAVGALSGHEDVNYIGVSGQADFTAEGESAKGRVSVWRLLGEQVLDQEVRDVDLAAEIGAQVPAGEMAWPIDELAAPLRIGGWLPLETDAGAAVRDAMQMAADEINAAGGLFGAPVELSFSDEASGATSAEELAEFGIAAMIGPLNFNGAESLVQAPDVLQIALTPSPALPLEAGGHVFRGISSDVLQAPPLANLALEDDAQVICVIYEEGAESEALADAFAAALEHKGGGVRPAVAITGGGVSEGDLDACLGL